MSSKRQFLSGEALAEARRRLSEECVVPTGGVIKVSRCTGSTVDRGAPDPFETIRTEVARLWAARGSRGAEVSAWAAGFGGYIEPSEDVATLARDLCAVVAGSDATQAAWDGLKQWRAAEAVGLGKLGELKAQLDTLLPSLAYLGLATFDQVEAINQNVAAILATPRDDEQDAAGQAAATLLGKGLLELLLRAGFGAGTGRAFSNRRAATLAAEAADVYGFKLNVDSLCTWATDIARQPMTNGGALLASVWQLATRSQT